MNIKDAELAVDNARQASDWQDFLDAVMESAGYGKALDFLGYVNAEGHKVSLREFERLQMGPRHLPTAAALAEVAS